MFILGLDLSLTSTGVAAISTAPAGCTPTGVTQPIRPKKLTGYERLRFIRRHVRGEIVRCLPDLVVVEGPSYGSVGRGQHERGGLWWIVMESIDDLGIPIAIAPPSNIKKYATGFGGGQNAGKDAVMLQACRRFDWFAGGNDEADALWAAAMGCEWLGEPVVEMPKEHRKALDGVEWPTNSSFSQVVTA
jgi:Holliday junction resolvasome RuvABC endonuclease subunit